MEMIVRTVAKTKKKVDATTLMSFEQARKLMGFKSIADLKRFVWSRDLNIYYDAGKMDSFRNRAYLLASDVERLARERASG